LKLLLPLLVGLGYKINIKRLRRLMGLQGWQTLYPKPLTTKVDAAAYKYPYLLKGLEVNRNNQVWAIDNIFIERLWRSVK
jgi:putative transposase